MGSNKLDLKLNPGNFIFESSDFLTYIVIEKYSTKHDDNSHKVKVIKINGHNYQCLNDGLDVYNL